MLGDLLLLSTSLESFAQNRFFNWNDLSLLTMYRLIYNPPYPLPFWLYTCPEQSGVVRLFLILISYIYIFYIWILITWIILCYLSCCLCKNILRLEYSVRKRYFWICLHRSHWWYWNKTSPKWIIVLYSIQRWKQTVRHTRVCYS